MELHIVYPTHPVEQNSSYSVPRMLFFLSKGISELGVELFIYSPDFFPRSQSDIKNACFFSIKIPFWVWLLRRLEYRFISRTANFHLSYFNKQVAKRYLLKQKGNKDTAILCLTYQTAIDLKNAGVSIPIVLWTHGFDYKNLSKNIQGVNNSNLVFFSSNAFVQELRKHFLLEGLLPPFVQLKNPFSLKDYAPYFEAKLPANPLVYFFGGGNLERKGSRLISHLIQTWKPSKETKLIVAGHGITTDYVVRKGLLEVHFFKFLKGEKLINTMANCHFLLMPSLWFENFPYLMYEGLALGLIPIASKLGGLPEMFDENLGFLISEPNDPELWVETLNITRSLTMKDIEGRRMKIRDNFCKEIEKNDFANKFINHVFINT